MLDYQDLHLKYVMGKNLSAEEFYHLEKWYEEQDQQEASQITNHSDIKEPSIGQIQDQIDLLLEQITGGLLQIKTLTEENNALKNSNETLRLQLINMLNQKAA
ncbi:hypothetical protein [Haliscomenobacter sp.]|uniref:hypothetical protein n=1 Tax=Haliscomenobacter sp. TaxID=2717303 RepID=UPI003364BB17